MNNTDSINTHSNRDNFSLSFILLKMLQSIRLLRASLSISKSNISVLVYFKILGIQKIWFSANENLEGKANRAEVIQAFIESCKRKFLRFEALNWAFGLEGSGILIRLLEGDVTEGTPIENSILWEIKRSLPFALSASEYSYRLLQVKNKRYRAIITVLKKEFLADLLNLLQDSGVVIDSIHVTSLCLAAGPKKSDYTFLYQGHDYSFATVIQKGQPVFFHIAHDQKKSRAWESAQRAWLKFSEGQENSSKPVFRYQSDDSLSWLPGQRALPYQTETLPAVTQSISSEIKNELSVLSSNSGYSPDLLPEASQKKNLRNNILWAGLTLFLILQIFTPAIYTAIHGRKKAFLSNSKFSSLHRDIKNLATALKKIEKDKNEILFLTKLLNKTSFTYSHRLRSLASMVSPNIVLKRIRGKKRLLIIDGYGKSLPDITDFLQDLEPEFPKGEFSMKTEKKGQLIGFTINWRSSKYKRKH